MTRALGSGVQGHLNQTTTDLASCMKITRQDGKVQYFTSHDVDINYRGDIYIAGFGFDPSAIADAIDLSVDNLDIDGIISSDHIALDELRNGLYDYAEVEFTIIIWSDLTLDPIKTRKGWFGEVTTTTLGYFKTEIRGLLANFQQRIVKKYSPTCREDLGGPQCRIPVLPSIIQRKTAISVGDYYRVPTSPTVGRLIELDVENNDFESDISVGWTTDFGQPQTTNAAGLDPYTGTKYVRAVEGTYDFRISQTIDISAYATGIDAGDLRAFFSVFHAYMINDADDEFSIELQALDTSQVFISDIFTTGNLVQGTDIEDRWYMKGGNYLTVPINTRYLKIVLTAQAVTDDTPRMAFDYCNLSILDINPARETFTNLIFNGGFETGYDDDWTAVVGTFAVDNSDSGTTPNTGQWFFQSKGEARTLLRHDSDLTNIEISTVAIDAEEIEAEISYYVTSNIATEPDQVIVSMYALDASNNIIKGKEGFKFLYQETWDGSRVTDDVWQNRTKKVLVPASTRKIRLDFDFVRLNGTNNNMCLDDVSLTLYDTEASEGQEVYENRIYQVTTAGTTATGQPAYNTTIAATTTDGTAVLTAVDAWTRHGTVATVTDRANFTISVTESRATSDDTWFTGGLLVWESGANKGVAMEVKDWDSATSGIELFQKMKYDIQASDKFRIQVACDKIYTTCRDRFANWLNFDGEPYLTGTDNLFQRGTKS